MNENNAGFGIRLAATIIDIIVFILPIVLLLNVILVESESMEVLLDLVIIAATIIMWIKWAGKTPGKHLMKIRIVSIDGTDITVKQAIIRYLSTILSTMFLFIGYIMIILREDNRSLHDLIAKTKVIYFEE